MHMLPILESVTDLVLVTDQHGNVLWTNGSAERLGVCESRSELLGRPLLEMFTSQDRVACARIVRSTVCASGQQSCELFAGFGDSAAVRWNLHAYDFHSDEDARFARVVVLAQSYVQPIAKEGAKDSDGERSMLEAIVHNQQCALDAVAQELRTPLSGMKATVECLMFDLDPEEHPEFMCLKLIEEEINRTSTVINEFVEFSQLLTGAYPWHWQKIDLHSVLATVQENMRLEAVQHAKLVRYTAQIDEREYVGDELAVVRMIERLVQNAIRHSSGLEIWVSVRSIAGGTNSFVCEVEDQGPGIPAEIVRHVEEILCTPNRSENATSQTVGAGLLACAATVAAHGGKLIVTPQQGKGAKVQTIIRGDLRAPLHIDAHRKLRDTVAYYENAPVADASFPEF